MIAKLDVQRYSCVAEHIRSSDVILTEKQKEHIIERRGKEFYDKYSPYFKEIIENPDYIFKDKKFENTAIASKTISLNSKKYQRCGTHCRRRRRAVAEKFRYYCHVRK